MRFHARCLGSSSLELPLMLGHFLPWFTLKGGDYPLDPGTTKGWAHIPVLEDCRHWNDSRSGYQRTHHHLPVIGLYDSRDPQVIQWQIATALEYGVQGFIVNWYGRYSQENVITLHWLKGVERWNREHPGTPFVYFLSLDSQMQWPTEGKKPVSLKEDFEYIRDHLVTDAYLLRDGRPVFSVFPYENNCSEWRRVLDEVFGAGRADLIWKDTPCGQGENASYAWVQPDREAVDLSRPCCWFQPDNAGDGFLRGFYKAVSQSGEEYGMAGVWPGFNNQLVSWAWSPDPSNPNIRPCVICRETTRGNTLDLTWKAYLDYLRRWAKSKESAKIPVPLIQLVTWNDYAETTTVEPARDYGTTPLKMCKARLRTARRIWKQKP
ncbi:MAG: hypothetical protein V2A34_04720 [Lentisphaerota bacterium]